VVETDERDAAYRRRTRGADADELQRVGGLLLYARTRRERVTGWLRHDMQRTTELRRCKHVCAGTEHSEGGQRHELV
jgi:hypothetical protein